MRYGEFMTFIYILLGILVNSIWGLAFLVPYYLKDIDPILLTLSRYFFYGITSLVLLFVSQTHWRSLTRLDWQKAMLFAFAGNIGYYFTLTLAIHYTGIALAALIVGALPITMMIYANFKNKEFSYQKLLLPIILILTGIIALKYFQYAHTPSEKNISDLIIGSLWALVALAIWTWFGVANAHYLKTHFHISGYSWTLAIGICCLLQVIILFPLVFYFNKTAVLNTWHDSHLFYQFIVGGIVLGVIVSWLATVWWNKISRHLPTTLAAQLLVFETISSLTYGYIVDRTVPKPIILLCVAVVLCGIVLGIRATIKSKK